MSDWYDVSMLSGHASERLADFTLAGLAEVYRFNMGTSRINSLRVCKMKTIGKWREKVIKSETWYTGKAGKYKEYLSNLDPTQLDYTHSHF